MHEEFFVVPNPWDAATARLLAQMGFAALATSSAAIAWTLGRRDGHITREEAISHAKMIGETTGLPVNGDFESGYGDTPAEVADTISAAIDAGVAGCSIEDVFEGSGGPLYGEDEALRRIEAARDAIERSGVDFVLTGRCEAILTKVPDAIPTVLKRLPRYADAGADVVYAPGLSRENDIAEVLSRVEKPLSVIAGLGGASDDLRLLQRLGVTRITLGSNLYKVAYGALATAAQALRDGEVALSDAVPSSLIEKTMPTS
ncbi:MAG: isocitrate lyase/phosphoenolpyruvate mutase family protein [Pseudomonadota bacterium]